MQYPSPLKSARLIKRYKRFLADVRRPDGSEFTLHCPNTGSMRHCAEPGSRIWYSTSDNPKRKYPCTWELVELDLKEPKVEGIACIHSNKANTLVREGIESGLIKELQGYATLATEVKYGRENSRIDLLLSDPEKPDCYIEVKSVTLAMGGGLGLFPDAVSTRGSKHLRELIEMARGGQRAVLLFCVQHSAIDRVAPAADIDPEYARTLREAHTAGVEVLAYGASLSPEEVRLSHRLQVEL